MAITVSYPVGDDLVNETLPLRLCHPVILQVAFPEVEEQSERSHPHLILRKMKVGDAEIKKLTAKKSELARIRKRDAG